MAHPVSVMMGNAVWAGDRLIINMDMTLENVMLHYHVKADPDGWLSGDELMARTKDFLDFVHENFIVTVPDTIFPSVILTGGMPFPGRMKYEFLRNHKIQFEVKFICRSAEKLKIVQTMGEREKGLQSTALINFHLGSSPQFVPLYSEIPVTIDLEKGQVIVENAKPEMHINAKEITVRVLSDLTAHGVPFELFVNEKVLEVASMKNEQNFTVITYFRPEGTDSLKIKWHNFSWPMRRIELIIKSYNHEKTIIISRFHPTYTLDSVGLAFFGNSHTD